MKFLHLSYFLLALLPFACQTSPTGRRQLAIASDAQMDEMGRAAFAEMKEKQAIERDPRLNSLVACVAREITEQVKPNQAWEVVVFSDPSANAFALPGGKIGVHAGMMKVARTPAQLAAVIGHEVGHVIAEHGKERVSETLVAQGGLAVASAILTNRGHPNHNLLLAALGIGAQVGVLLPHSRAQESESDVIGIQLMAQAGFDPRQSTELWKNMDEAGKGQPPEFLSSHPSHGSRIETLEGKMPEALGLFEKAKKRPGC